jgi:hypothetical protein
MNEEKIAEAQGLAEDAQAAPAPIAAELQSEAQEIRAEAMTEPENAADPADDIAEEIVGESLEEALEDFAGTAVLPTGGILEMGHVLDLLFADSPDAGNDPASTPSRNPGNQPTAQHPVYGSVYNNRR